MSTIQRVSSRDRTGVINHQLAGTISGFATAILGYLVQQPAAGEQPQPQK